MIPIQNLGCVLVFTYINWTTTAFWDFICCLYFVWYVCFFSSSFAFLVSFISSYVFPLCLLPLAHLLHWLTYSLPDCYYYLYIDSSSSTISWSKFFFHVKSETNKFLQVRKVWIFLYRFIYWARLKWQKVDSFFWIYRFSSKLSYHSYQHRICKIMFLTRTFVKTNSN